MSVRTWPTYAVAGFRWHKADQSAVFKSPFGSQSLAMGVPLWEVSMMGVSETRLAARQIEAFIDSLNGYTDQIEIWNVEHPAPTGTMRGTMTLNADAAQGATSLVITAGVGQAGTTLLTGDLLGLGTGLTQQVVPVSANATANGSGVITVSIGIALRNAFVATSAVTWDKPKALFRQKTLFDGMQYKPDGADAWSMSLREDWRP